MSYLTNVVGWIERAGVDVPHLRIDDGRPLNKKHLSFAPKSRKERRVPLNDNAVAALNSMLLKKHPKTDLVFHQSDGTPWKSILQSFHSLLSRCGLKRVGIHALRHTFGAHLAQRGVPMAFIRDLLGHHSVSLTEKYYAHLAPNNMSTAVKQLETQPVKTSLPNSLPNCTKSENVAVENPTNAVPLTHSSARCYVPMVRSFAKVAELADALDLGSKVCVFCPLRNPLHLFEASEEKDLDSLKLFAGIFEYFEAF
jgi:hypothetical protein